MSIYQVEGGRTLEGTAIVHGAKNSVLPILAAAVLCPGVSVVHNCPDLSDVRASMAILEHLGCRVERSGDTVTVDASGLTRNDVPDALMREMRSSVIFLGAILARTGAAELSMPGGCELGPRPIDLHLAAIRALGCTPRTYGGLAAPYDVIFNTVPAPVIGEELLSRQGPDTLLLELASAPGGIDRAAAEKRGLFLLDAPSLPGRFSPKASGELIKEAVYHMLQERRDLG